MYINIRFVVLIKKYNPGTPEVNPQSKVFIKIIIKNIENTGSGELQFICVQAKTNSLEQYGLEDAVLS